MPSVQGLGCLFYAMQVLERERVFSSSYSVFLYLVLTDKLSEEGTNVHFTNALNLQTAPLCAHFREQLISPRHPDPSLIQTCRHCNYCTALKDFAICIIDSFIKACLAISLIYNLLRQMDFSNKGRSEALILLSPSHCISFHLLLEQTPPSFQSSCSHFLQKVFVLSSMTFKKRRP